MRGVVALYLLALAIGAARANPLIIESPPTRVALLELYTSEGCSSCPPADRWLSSLVEDPRLWRQVAPVALHVDYWDYLGWSDRFADPAYSQRQRTLARQGHLSTVYTPGLVLNGEEWRSWFAEPTLRLSQAPPIGVLRLEVDGGDVNASFQPMGLSPVALELNLTMLGFGLETAVGGGGNRGRRLAHDFVVLDYQRRTMVRDSAGWSAWASSLQLHSGAPRLALVAWISETGTARPLQVAGGWLPAAADVGQ